MYTSKVLENFDPNLCTHLIYGFLSDFKEDISKKTLEIMSLKKKNPNLKIMASIQGKQESIESLTTRSVTNSLNFSGRFHQLCFNKHSQPNSRLHCKEPLRRS